MKKNGMYLFHEKYSSNKEFVNFYETKHGKYALRVPEELAADWKEYGFRGYNEGMIWITNPSEPVLIEEDWGFLDDSGIEIVRTAFGDICIWQGNEFLWLNIYSGKATNFSTKRTDVFFNLSLTDASFTENFLMEKLFKKALKKLGPLTVDECYGFAPLPSLGGDMIEEYLVKVKIREYVSICAQSLT